MIHIFLGNSYFKFYQSSHLMNNKNLFLHSINDDFPKCGVYKVTLIATPLHVQYMYMYMCVYYKNIRGL